MTDLHKFLMKSYHSFMFQDTLRKAYESQLDHTVHPFHSQVLCRLLACIYLGDLPIKQAMLMPSLNFVVKHREEPELDEVYTLRRCCERKDNSSEIQSSGCCSFLNIQKLWSKRSGRLVTRYQLYLY